ncbi:transporter [Massilia sp. Root351]|nr:transporter [Massilia sp. Root351]
MAGGTRPGLVIGTVMLCHFVAAFAALGMPPFFALILQGALHSGQPFLAGWLYVVPTFFTALSSPWWGRLADRYGKKRLLLRAQLGLAASFLLASFAPSVEWFVAALVLQGLLGGTFSASNAYLATVVSGAALMRSLTLMQWSARAALVIAPLGLGWLLMQTGSPLLLYRWLAALPLCAALGIWLLPASGAAAKAAKAQAARVEAVAATPRQVYLLQWLFVFATVATMPYFVSYAQAGAATPAIAGLLFGLPHLVYLLCAVPLSRWLGRSHLPATMAGACALLALALAGQAWSGGAHWQPLAAWRVLMGLGMTLAYLALHGLIASLVQHDNAGHTFGWFESSSKWGAVAAGLAAGLMVQQTGLRAPFVAGAGVMLACGLYAAALACAPTQKYALEKP